MAGFQAHDWAVAESAFREAVTANPSFARAWKLLGMVYAAQERFERAVEPFERACDLEPNEKDACYFLARTYYTLNRYEDAIRAFDRALEHGDDRAKTMHGLALTHEAMGQSEQAESYFREAIRTGDRTTLVDYAKFLHREGRGLEGLELLRKAGAAAEAERLSRAIGAAPSRGIASAARVQFSERSLAMIVQSGAAGRKHQIETSVRMVEIEWPSGRRQRLEDVAADRLLTIIEP